MKRTQAILIVLVMVIAGNSANAEWVKRTTNTFAWFKDIQFVDAASGWIAGADGVLLSTVDGGATWIQAEKFTNDSILQVHFLNEQNGWLLCERDVFNRGANPTSYLRRTTDGGRTWEKIDFESPGRERITKLVFNESGKGIAFGEGGVFFRLQDDGKTWKKTQTSMHYLLLAGGYATDKVGAIVGAAGTILFTEDAGLTWEKASLLGDTDTKFNSVFFGQKGAWAVGSKGRIFRSAGGGRMWRQQPSTVTANLTDVYFSTPTSGWAIGENGVIVRTRDGGTNWTDVPSKTTHRLEKITFNGDRGWVVGFGGTVLTYDPNPTPADAGSKPVIMKRS